MSFAEDIQKKDTSDILFSDFNHTYTKLKLYDFLNPRIINSDKCTYYCFSGEILESKNAKIIVSDEIKNIHFAKFLFTKEIRKILSDKCLDQTKELIATFEIRRENKFTISIQNFKLEEDILGEESRG